MNDKQAMNTIDRIVDFLVTLVAHIMFLAIAWIALFGGYSFLHPDFKGLQITVRQILKEKPPEQREDTSNDCDNSNINTIFDQTIPCILYLSCQPPSNTDYPQTP